jgi:acyl carrier protein
MADNNTLTDSDAPIDITQVPELTRHAVRMVAPEAPDSVTGTDRLIGDLGFHSLALVELAFVLEELFQLDPITPEQAMGIEQVGDIEQLITAALDAGFAQRPTTALIQETSDQYGAQWPAEFRVAQ